MCLAYEYRSGRQRPRPHWHTRFRHRPTMRAFVSAISPSCSCPVRQMGAPYGGCVRHSGSKLPRLGADPANLLTAVVRRPARAAKPRRDWVVTAGQSNPHGRARRLPSPHRRYERTSPPVGGPGSLPVRPPDEGLAAGCGGPAGGRLPASPVQPGTTDGLQLVGVFSRMTVRLFTTVLPAPLNTPPGALAAVFLVTLLMLGTSTEPGLTCFLSAGLVLWGGVSSSRVGAAQRRSSLTVSGRRHVEHIS
ncbi:hypothetical protein SAMN05428944_0112 [Streptomyces sp. 1222.5]|nr:hypothetical protein BX260_0109 [Streptomyces sp. 5112.2]SEB53791.1 hypothetical protein SAMN05428944_0112 [Streptomyces sp. 1222.5]